jgi:DNA repair exonuclease SbcCD ATPase subunit
MNISSVKIENFMRVRKAKSSFKDKDIVGVIAQNVKNKKRANHQGKTSVIEAIRWCLTGRSRAVRDIELIHYGADFVKVSVCLVDLDGNKHIVTRGRDSNNIGSLVFGTIDDMSAAQAAINDLLGMTPEDFDQVFYFQQQEIHQFMMLPPDKKKTMLMGWLKNDHWKNREATVVKDAKDMKDKIKTLQMELASKQKNLGDEQQLQDEYGLKISKLAVLKDSRAKLEEDLFKLKNSIKISVDDVKKFKVKLVEIDKKIASLDVTTSQRNRIEHLTNKYKMELEGSDGWEAKLKHKRAVVSELAQSFSDANAEMRLINQKLDTFKKHKHGLCPLINEPCDRIKATPERMEELRELADKGTNAVNLCKEAAELNQASIAKLEEIQDKTNKLVKLKLQLSEIENAESVVKALELDKKNIEEGLASFDPTISEKIEDAQEAYTSADDQMQIISRGVGALKSKLDVICSERDNIVTINEQIITFTQELNDLQYIAFMFGKKGIPSLEIENCFQEIEDNVNFILSSMNGEYAVSFKPDRELSSWEEHCVACGHTFAKGARKPECPECGTERLKKRKDELRVMVVESGREISFDMASGGLKTIISLAVRAALSMLIRRQNNSTFSVLFLDEIDSALDEAYRETLMDLVSQVFVKRLGFSQIFWISHNKSISQSVPHTLLVKGFETHSELEWV